MTTQAEVISELEYNLEIARKRIRELEYDCGQLQRQVNESRARFNKNRNNKGARRGAVQNTNK